MTPREAFYRFALSRISGPAELCDLPCGDGAGARLLASHENVSRCFAIDDWERIPAGADFPKITFLPKDLSDPRRIIHRRFQMVTAFQLPGAAGRQNALMHNLIEILAPSGQLLFAGAQPGSDLAPLCGWFANAGAPLEAAAKLDDGTHIIVCRKPGAGA